MSMKPQGSLDGSPPVINRTMTPIKVNLKEPRQQSAQQLKRLFNPLGDHARDERPALSIPGRGCSLGLILNRPPEGTTCPA